MSVGKSKLILFVYIKEVGDIVNTNGTCFSLQMSSK